MPTTILSPADYHVDFQQRHHIRRQRAEKRHQRHSRQRNRHPSALETIYSTFASPGQSYLVNTIQATSNNNSVIFTETQDLINTSAPSSEIEANPPQYGGQNLGGVNLVANVGTTLATPILIQVSGLDVASNGVPNVAVRIVNEQASPTLSCAPQGGYADPGSVLTNAQGLATCYPVFSGSGNGVFFITIGGVPSSDITTAQYLQAYPQYSGDLTGYTFTSNPGAPAAFQIVSGNNQVGTSAPAESPGGAVGRWRRQPRAGADRGMERGAGRCGRTRQRTVRDRQ